MNNLLNNNFQPDIEYYQRFLDPSKNDSFNQATHPSNKPIIYKHIFAVDSRQRDYNIYPDANNYSIDIPDTYRNITGIELKAAMLPRTEYNVNSCNKYIDFVIGDYIKSIIIPKQPITINNKDYNNTNYVIKSIKLIIDPPTLTNSTLEQAEIEVDLDQNSRIISHKIINHGSGYSSSNPPSIKLGDMNIKCEIGNIFYSKFREGQYTIGGNPQFINNSTNPVESVQSWIPSNFINEVESSMSYAILKDTNYCYSRQSCLNELNGSDTSASKSDYPLFFNVRLMSQYPSLDSYSKDLVNRNNPDNFETNSCRFNRIYITNSLIFKSKDLPIGNFKDDEGFEYSVLKYDKISDNNYILYCSLVNALSTINGKYWSGLSYNDSNYKIAHWELLFANGQHELLNSATLLGYKKRNYTTGIFINSVETKNIITNTDSTLIPRGLTYCTEHDYYLVGDPEYVIMSFGTSNVLSDLNNRLDSNDYGNLNNVFACLIFDTVHPAVLQDLSSGKKESIYGSITDSNNNIATFMNNDNSFNEVTQLNGNIGSQNVNFNKPPGQMKAMKGTDFDRKVIEFVQPISQVNKINLRFSKFTTESNKRSNNELYDFHGKEHLLLFEITCSDLLTGNRS